MKRIDIKTAMETEVKAIFTQPERDKHWITAQDIESVKTATLLNAKIIKVLETKADKVHAKAFHSFIEYDSERLAKALNQMYCSEGYLQEEVGKLAYKLRLKRVPEFNEFQNAMLVKVTAFVIIQALMDSGKIVSETKVISHIDENTGKKTWRNQVVVSIGIKQDTNKYYVHGVSSSICIMQKTTKVRAGGKAIKLSGKEKLFLMSAGATPLRLIDIDSNEIAKYIRSTEWYTNALNGVGGSMKVDKLVLELKIEEQVKKFELMQQLDRFYLPMWMDYRTRLYYELTEMGFNPHGKTFETSLYELADPILINDCGADNLFYSAVTIVDGRMPHGEAISKFKNNTEYYLTCLKTPCEDMGKTLYNKRLAQAINDYFEGIPSRFLLSEDATNGGMQHGGIGFRSEQMMLASNVGGSPRQEDSHGVLQEKLNLASRDEAKKIHQPLLHGSSLNTIASVLGITVKAAKAMMIEAYGHTVLNIANIADWGTQVVDNDNTALFWTTRDGFKAQSIAYTESVPLTLYAFSSTTVAGYTQTKLHSDMPLLLDRKGNPVYGYTVSEDGKQDTTMGKQNKLRGLYANITHSIDGTSLRDVIRCVKREHGQSSGGVYKHDNFLVHANHMKTVRRGYWESLLAEYDYQAYHKALAEIVNQFKGVNKPLVPTLTVGNGTRDMIINSHYYLAP